jgi:hypothetical protein
MIPREHLGTAVVPGGEELRLFRHGRDFIIVLGRNELMNTRKKRWLRWRSSGCLGAGRCAC